MPRLYQPSPADDSHSWSTSPSSNIGDQYSYQSLLRGYPTFIDQNSQFGEAHTPYTGYSQDYITPQEHMHELDLPHSGGIYNRSHHVDNTVPSGSTYTPLSTSDYETYLLGEHSRQETEKYLRNSLSIPDPVPLNLWSLPNEPFPKNRRPKISKLIKLAIWGSPSRCLTLNEICSAIEERYISYKEEADQPWKRSIRHNLSLKAMFINIARSPNQRGKGCYWTLDVRMGEGNKRECKRRDPRSANTGRDDGYYSEASDVPPENYSAYAATPDMAIHDVQHQHGYVHHGVYDSAPHGATYYDSSFVVQANATMMFAPSLLDPHALGMGPASLSPTQDSAYVLSPTTFADQSPGASLGTNGAPGMAPYTGLNWSAHQRNAGSLPARRHAHEPYHTTPAGWEDGAGVGFSDAWRHGPGPY